MNNMTIELTTILSSSEQEYNNFGTKHYVRITITDSDHVIFNSCKHCRVSYTHINNIIIPTDKIAILCQPTELTYKTSDISHSIIIIK